MRQRSIAQPPETFAAPITRSSDEMSSLSPSPPFVFLQSTETLPDSLREQIRRRGQTFFEVGRQLRVEGQATGEIAAGDPDQLMLALVVCLEGLTKLALFDGESFKKHGPDAALLLRMLKLGLDQR